jgi:hypothetical protein
MRLVSSANRSALLNSGLFFVSGYWHSGKRRFRTLAGNNGHSGQIPGPEADVRTDMGH